MTTMTPHRTSLSARLGLTLAATVTLLAALPAQAADGWQWLPALNDPAWQPDLAVALTGSRVMPGTGPDANAWGLELSAHCGLMQTPDRRLRTHVNLSHASRDGTTVNAFELSPRYTVPLTEALSIGVGPSLGAFRVDTGAGARTLPGYGAAVGMNYRVGALYTGVDLRYHATTRRSGIDHDPLTLAAKIGVNF
jgi:opacity protein-like surface antigen